METLMQDVVFAEMSEHFKALSSVVPLRAITSEQDYDEAVTALNALLDRGAAHIKHPLAGLVAALGALIADYDEVHFRQKAVSPVAMLRFLMDQHGVTQAGLPEIGSQGVVSEILHGKRALNLRQIKSLSARFHVPASVFIDPAG